MIDLKRLRGSTIISPTNPTSAAYVGPIGEILVDTDGFGHGGPLLRVEDGVTAGGWPIGGTPPAGGAFHMDPVTTGVLHTVVLSSFQTCTYWTSATGGSKTTDLPGAVAGNLGYLWVIKTTLNNGDTHDIVPLSGTIDGNATLTFSDFRTSLSMISDGAGNWMLI